MQPRAVKGFLTNKYFTQLHQKTVTMTNNVDNWKLLYFIFLQD